MNIVYGAIALIVSFVISKIFSNYNGTKAKVFMLAFVSEFMVISLLGGVFFLFKLGFFATLQSPKEIVIRVFGLAVFLGLLVAMKAINTNAKFQNR